MGFGDDIKEFENSVDGQTSAQQQTQNTNDSGFDTAIDSAVDGFATKEGLSASFDPEVNNLVNDEVNKFL
ncbi:MAG: hypothetical protein SEPTF4163_000986 [Sporothrix epigloea]